MIVAIISIVLLGFCVIALLVRPITRGFNHNMRGEAFGSAREAGPKLDLAGVAVIASVAVLTGAGLLAPIPACAHSWPLHGFSLLPVAWRVRVP